MASMPTLLIIILFTLTTSWAYLLPTNYQVGLFHDYDHIILIIPIGYLPMYHILSSLGTLHIYTSETKAKEGQL